MVSVQSSWNQVSPLKPSLLETRGFRTLSTPLLSNWIKIERALSPTLLSLWPPETGTHPLPPSSPRLITFSCLRPASPDTFNSCPVHKIPLFFFFSRWMGQSRPLVDAPSWCISFSHRFHWKKSSSANILSKNGVRAWVNSLFASSEPNP